MTAQEAVAFLASKRRTVLLGGMAVILHGLSRNTKDYDIWLDPLPDAQAWAAAIQQLLTREPSLQAQRISAFGGWTPISVANVPAVGTEDRLIRIAGAEGQLMCSSSQTSLKQVISRAFGSVEPR